jgi:thiamine-phosphate pyrophosphorylase
MNKFKNLENKKIYLVSSSNLSKHSTIYIIESFLKAGGKLFQIREKEMKEDKLIKLCEEIKKLSIKYNATFILNDNPSLAKKVNADGVHLGQNDMSLTEARKIIGNDKIIGISTHNKEEIKHAIENGADYINIGPVFKTGTKPGVIPLGVEKIKELIKHISIPFTLMGGIKEDNINLLLDFNPLAFAMITQITKSENPFEKTKELLAIV